MMHSPLNDLFEGLPVVFLSTVEDLTFENLKKWADELQNEKVFESYKWERVTAFPWLERIERDRIFD